MAAKAAGHEEQKKQRPNIIVMIADDCTHRDLGCYGSTNPCTPNIDALASQGIRFTDFTQAAPMSSPTRHCLMTGLYPVRSGAYPNHTFASEGVRSVVQHMRAEGYRVALEGKRHIAPQEIFDYEYLSGGNADVDTSKIRPFILDAKSKNEPFCLFVCSHQPHTPWNKGDASQFDPEKVDMPSYYVDTPETREGFVRYLAEVNYMDNQVGEVLALLDETGISDNTVFFFTSEQGNSLPFAKWTCYDMGLQTAMIVRWPGVIKPGSTSDAIAGYVDMVPTLVDIAGGIPDADLDGRSFKKILTDGGDTFKEYAFALQTTRGTINGSDHYGIRSVKDKRYLYIRNLTPEAEFSCAMTNMKDPIWKSWVEKAKTDKKAAALVDRYTHRPAEELYDRVKDPEMKRNLAGMKKYAGVQERLSDRLDAWMKQQGDLGQATEMDAMKHQTTYLEKQKAEAAKIEAEKNALYIADPYILEADGVFYAYGTHSRNGIEVYRSSDMKHWEGPCGAADGGLALHKDDSWGDRDFWAPEVYRIDGRYVMTYSVAQRIAIAFSDSPLGPFVQEEQAVYTPDQNSIDSHIFIDDDGQAYMYWVRFGLGKGNEIRAAKLSPDLKSIVSEQVECLCSQPGTWEVTDPKVRVSEGPFVLKHNGMYYLTYSCNHFQSQDYAVGYAVSENPLGPWKRYEGNPILHRHGGYYGTGHHSFLNTSDGMNWIVYHVHKNGEKVTPRKLLISPYRFEPQENGPDKIVIGKKIIAPEIAR